MSTTSSTFDEYCTFVEEYCVEDLSRLVESDSKRLEVSWRDLYQYDPDVAELILKNPDQFVPTLERAVAEADLDVQAAGALDTMLDREAVTVVITDLGERTKAINSLREDAVGTYVGVDAQVDLRTQVEPRAEEVAVECRCGHVEYYPQIGDQMTLPHDCESCERQGPFTIDDGQTTYRDHQIIEVSDPPETSTGRSDSLRIEAYDDLAGSVEAGDRVTVYGQLETKSIADETNPDRRRPLRMNARAIEHANTGFEDFTPERIDEIQTLAERPDLYDALIESIAPHIMTGDVGDAIKLAIALQLFGGVERDLAAGYKRGNINIMLIGTPGTAKSQYLQAANELAPKSIKVSGKNARPAGMTATAVQSDMTGEWTLKAGALVKASGGLAAIDEFDKMASETKASLHEALEDQSISVAKADINTTLPAKTSVLAASNPEAGIFNNRVKIAEQIDIGPTILSRFDLIFGLQDFADEERDRATARLQHDAGDPDAPDPEPEIETDLLTEYIAYARQNVAPSYASDAVRDDLVEFYVELRQQSNGEDDDQVRPVGPRINELLRRLSQASARARLSQEITMADAERVKSLFKRTIGQVGLTDTGQLDGNMLDGYGDVEDTRKRVLDALDGQSWMFPSDIGLEADMDEARVRDRLDKLMNETNPPKVEEKNGKYRRA